VTTTPDYSDVLRGAERELKEAATADDVRRIWKQHLGALGHRTLGRLLLGRPAEELLARRGARSEGD